jgi:Ca2+-binding RTX toxin-like protein
MTLHPLRRPVLLGLGASLLLAAPASAATLTADNGGFTYRAAPGETNRVIVVAEEGELRIGDNVPIDLQAAACRRADWDDATTVRCPLGALRVEAGDGNDRVSFLYDFPAGVTLSADGGAGNDSLEGPTGTAPVTLAGGDGDDELKGGLGNDTLDGGAGDDTLVGQAGDDTLLGGPGNDDLAGLDGADRIDGGAGIDTIAHDWLGSDSPGVRVTLSGGADDGRPGEGDDITNVEIIEVHQPATLIAALGTPVRFTVSETTPGASKLVGSNGDDQLRSFHYADVIDGRGGDDTIEGWYGDDVITGGPGRDTINADAGSGACTFLVCRVGAGNDRINVRDGERDSVICGPGRDVVIADRKDVVAEDCEVVKRR